MYNILVSNETQEIKDYDKDFTLFNNVCIASKSGNVLQVYPTLNSSNCNVYQSEEEIVDFTGNKYLYIDGAVVENPNYVAPEV